MKTEDRRSKWGPAIILVLIILITIAQVCKKQDESENTPTVEPAVADSILCAEMRRQGEIPEKGECLVPKEGFDLQNLYPLEKLPEPNPEYLPLPKESPPVQRADSQPLSCYRPLKNFVQSEFSPLLP